MSSQRQDLLKRLKTDSFDLLVIGGGITGAGIALDAATRRLKVALVEKGDFASGTSSKSTKLVHGGLRYLKQLELRLVREVGRERAIVHRLAPHLVKSEKMLLPIVRGGTYGKVGTSFGLWLYDFLASVTGTDRRRMLSKQKTLNEEPLLRNDGLLGSGLYAEYRTDDARLTIEVVKTAIRHGAVCLNYVEAENFTENKGKISGANCLDHANGERFGIAANLTVSAAGPWVDGLRKKDNSLTGKRLFLSKGAHIVVAWERLPLKHATYFDVPVGRMIFAIPRQRTVYIGTTETPFEGNTNHVFANLPEVEYLLNGANRMFPTAKLTLSDVESTWAGMRPLIYEEGKSAGEMSRKDEMFVSPSGLISIAGGKLTGYRKMAGKVVDLVVKKLASGHSRQFSACQTHQVSLSENPFENAAEVIDFQKVIEEKLKPFGLPGFYAAYLVENYGRPALAIIDQALAISETGEEAILKSELRHCFEHELVLKPADFFERRTGRLYFNIRSVEQHLEAVLRAFQVQFQWPESTLQQEREDMLRLLKNTCPMKS